MLFRDIQGNTSHCAGQPRLQYITLTQISCICDSAASNLKAVDLLLLGKQMYCFNHLLHNTIKKSFQMVSECNTFQKNAQNNIHIFNILTKIQVSLRKLILTSEQIKTILIIKNRILKSNHLKKLRNTQRQDGVTSIYYLKVQLITNNHYYNQFNNQRNQIVFLCRMNLPLIIQLFHEVSLVMQQERIPTLPKVYPSILLIHKKLKIMDTDKDEIKLMKNELLKQFNSYIFLPFLTLSINQLLLIIREILSQQNQPQIKCMKPKKLVFKNKVMQEIEQPILKKIKTQQNLDQMISELSILQVYINTNNQTLIDEIQKYQVFDLNFESSDIDYLTKFRVKNETLFPLLSQVYSRLLCLPSSSSQCEKIFSKAGDIVSKKRKQLKSDTIKNLSSQIIIFKRKTQILVNQDIFLKEKNQPRKNDIILKLFYFNK